MSCTVFGVAHYLQRKVARVITDDVRRHRLGDCVFLNVDGQLNFDLRVTLSPNVSRGQQAQVQCFVTPSRDRPICLRIKTRVVCVSVDLVTNPEEESDDSLTHKSIFLYHVNGDSEDITIFTREVRVDLSWDEAVNLAKDIVSLRDLHHCAKCRRITEESVDDFMCGPCHLTTTKRDWQVVATKCCVCFEKVYRWAAFTLPCCRHIMHRRCLQCSCYHAAVCPLCRSAVME